MFSLRLQTIIILVFLCLGSINTHGQDDLAFFLPAHPDDAELLALNYISPLSKSLGFNASSSWYNTAKPHSTGFDLTVIGCAAYIPDEDYFTSFLMSQYQDLELLSPNDMMVPTIFGSEDITPEYRILSTGETFEGPTGNSLEEEFGYEAVVMPMAQLGVGVIPHTDIKLRFMPTIEFDEDFEARLWGAGILHGLNQYFPRGDELLVDISLFASYSNVDTEISLDKPFEGENQRAEQDIDSWSVEGLVSYNLSVVTFYAGLGYNAINSELDILGTYDLGNEILIDPVSGGASYNGVKATIGLRLKLAIVTLHGEYAYNRYHILSAGLGISID